MRALLRWLPLMACAIASMPYDAMPHGINGHVHVTGWAIERLPPGELADLFAEQEAFEAALFAASFPDSGYAISDPYGEMAHWPPFFEAHLRQVRADVGPPFDTPEKRRKAAFAIGLGCHGLQDEIFDSVFLWHIAEHDGQAQEQADSGTDAMLFTDGYLRWKPAKWAPVDDLIASFAAEGHAVDAETIEAGMTRVKAIVIDAFGGIAPVFDRQYRPLLPWTAEHYVDPAVPGSIAAEIPATRAFIEAVWARLHGRFPAAGFVAHPYPDGRRRLRSVDPATTSSWVTLVLGIGARVGSVTPDRITFEGPDGPVAYDLRHTRWGGAPDDWTRIVQLRPRVELALDAEYTVDIAPGIELIDGSVLADGWRYSFRTACGEGDDCPPEPADGGVQPVDAAVDAMAPDAADDAMAPDAMPPDAIPLDVTAPDPGEDAHVDAIPGDTRDAVASSGDVATAASVDDSDGCSAAPGSGGAAGLLLLGLALTRRRRSRQPGAAGSSEPR